MRIMRTCSTVLAMGLVLQTLLHLYCHNSGDSSSNNKGSSSSNNKGSSSSSSSNKGSSSSSSSSNKGSRRRGEKKASEAAATTTRNSGQSRTEEWCACLAESIPAPMTSAAIIMTAAAVGREKCGTSGTARGLCTALKISAAVVMVVLAMVVVVLQSVTTGAGATLSMKRIRVRREVSRRCPGLGFAQRVRKMRPRAAHGKELWKG